MMESSLNLSTTVFPSESVFPLKPGLSYVLASLMILTTIVTIIGNLLVIIIIFRSPKIQTITSGFLLNLAISDLTTGVLLLPFATSVQLNRTWVYTSQWCSVLGFVYLVVGIVSTWTLASLSMERYIAVNHPLKYHQMLTKFRVWMTILLNWGFAVFMASLPYMARNTYRYLPDYGFCLPDFYSNGVPSIVILTTGICLPFVIMCFNYISIGRVACTQVRKKVIECNEDHCVYVSPKNKDYRAAKILAALAGVFALCWLPFTILCCWQTTGTDRAPALVTSVAFWLTLLSSAINPWLYAILNRTFRAAMRQLATQTAHKLPLLHHHFRVGPTGSPAGRAGATVQGGGGASLEMTEYRDTQRRWTRRSTACKEERSEKAEVDCNERTNAASKVDTHSADGNHPSCSEHQTTAVMATIEMGDKV